MSGLTTEAVLAWFDRISAVPRTSGHEKAVSDLVREVAEAAGLPAQQDQVHNLIVRKPARPGQEARPMLTLQCHLDMVGAAEPGCDHDFLTDPVVVRRDGDTLTAEGTTLGADDGIGVSIAMCLLESEDIPHGPLEFLFTTQEEVGLVGAKELGRGLLEGRYLLNLDGEQEGVFLTSCAGGTTIDVTFDLAQEPVTEQAVRIHVGSLPGGHSGLDIDKGRDNAILLLAGLLSRLQGARIASFEAPGAFNAISREADVVVVGSDVTGTVDTWREEVLASTPEARIEVTPTEVTRAWSAADTQRFVGFLGQVPNGVFTMSKDLEGLVESSLNTGVVTQSDSEVVVTLSTRSCDDARHTELLERLDALAGAAGARTRRYGAYPAWEFDPANPLMQQAEQVYQDLFGEAPRIEGVHGGLECAVLKERYPDVPMLSIGSELADCHTPSERASIRSVGRFAELAEAIVTRIE